MSYVVTQHIGGKPYYYLVQNVRLHEGWKKYKTYLGAASPEPQILAEAQARLRAKVEGSPAPRYRYLSVAQAEALKAIRAAYRARLQQFDRFLEETFERDFISRFAYHSNAIEGNTLDLDQTKIVIERSVTPAKDLQLREIYEAKNMEDAFKYAKAYTRDLNVRFICNLHRILMHHLGHKEAGRFRAAPVKILGAHFVPPDPEDIPDEMERFLTFYRFVKRTFHPVEVAGLVHLKFEEIHPFIDGNGRVGRLLLNFVLMRAGYPPLIIPYEARHDYYAFQEAAQDRDYGKFIAFIADYLKKDYAPGAVERVA